MKHLYNILKQTPRFANIWKTDFSKVQFLVVSSIWYICVSGIQIKTVILNESFKKKKLAHQNLKSCLQTDDTPSTTHFHILGLCLEHFFSLSLSLSQLSE